MPTATGRVDGVLGDVALDPFVVGPLRLLLRQSPDALLHDGRELPALGDVLGQPAHALGVGGEDRDRAHVVQEVLRGHGLRADAALGERHVLRQVEVHDMSEHGHRHALFERQGREGIGRIGRGGNDVGVGIDRQQVRRVAAARALDVVHVDDAAGHRRHRVLAEAELVDRVGVQVHGEVVAIGGDERAVDHRRARTEVFVDLHAQATAGDGLLDRCRVRGAAAEKAEVQAVLVGTANELAHDVRARARRIEVRARGHPDHGGAAARERVLRLLRREKMRVALDAAGGDDHRVAVNHGGVRPAHHAG